MSNSVIPWSVAHQAPLSMGVSRQEYWSGLPFPSPGNLPDPEIESRSLTLQADSLPSEPPGKPIEMAVQFFDLFISNDCLTHHPLAPKFHSHPGHHHHWKSLDLHIYSLNTFSSLPHGTLHFLVPLQYGTMWVVWPMAQKLYTWINEFHAFFSCHNDWGRCVLCRWSNFQMLP